MWKRGCDGLPAQAGRLDFAGRLHAPLLKVLQKLRYRSEHVVEVSVEYYSQLDRVPSARKQDRGFGGELSGRVHGYALTLGFGRHGVEAGALRVPYWLTVFRDTKAPGEQHGEAVSPTEPRSKACSAA